VGRPGDASGQAGQVDVIGGFGGKGDPQQERGRVDLDPSHVGDLAAEIFDEKVVSLEQGVIRLNRAEIDENSVFVKSRHMVERRLMEGERRRR